MIRAYRPGCAFYEMVDWLRKMLLGGMLMLLHRGSTVQVIAGTIISFAFFGIHLGLRPYRKVASNWLKACIETQIFLTMQLTLVVRFTEGCGSGARPSTWRATSGPSSGPSSCSCPARSSCAPR